MAVERMPDFNEIKNLIGNLEKLDQSFRKITTEYDGHAEKLRTELAEALKKESAHFLVGGYSHEDHLLRTFLFYNSVRQF